MSRANAIVMLLSDGCQVLSSCFQASLCFFSEATELFEAKGKSCSSYPKGKKIGRTSLKSPEEYNFLFSIHTMGFCLLANLNQSLKKG